MTMRIAIQIGDGSPVEQIDVSRIIGFAGSKKRYEVHDRQRDLISHVYHDPNHGPVRLAHDALSAVLAERAKEARR